MQRPPIDIAIVGAGLSAAYTLIHYIARLQQEPPRPPISIVVFDTAEESWTGLAWGRATGPHSLTLTPLGETLQQPEERARFKAWLAELCHRTLDSPGDESGSLASAWLHANRHAVASGACDHVLVPRSMFGQYICERTTDVIARAQQRGLLTYTRIRAEVVDVERVDATYRLSYVTSRRARGLLSSRKVVLALGRLPQKAICVFPSGEATDGVCVIPDVYAPSIAETARQVARALRQTRQRSDVLILGSKASALETIYTIIKSSVDDRLGRLFLLSPSGKLPDRVVAATSASSYRPRSLNALLSSRPISARSIRNAARADLRLAEKHGEIAADIHSRIWQAVVDALDRSPMIEQEKFVALFGDELGRLQRRSGIVYLDAVNDLIAEDRLRIVAGGFERYVPKQDGGAGFDYRTRRGITKRVTANLRVIINCAGQEEISTCSAPVVNSLIHRGLCVPNASRRGFHLTERFEAADNLYVMGPLIAGNANASFRVWDAESCTRIIQMSDLLAAALVSDTRLTEREPGEPGGEQATRH